ncbi:RelA/SpoT family protein [Treponema brennaborense]|uniref:RelA/SpoT family protein n=1 Tax=Treponema brennaborense TaxID=81028 RepID=UPI001FE16647|nr:RelA/SpoT family protein [Treponema brennaborense]
MNTERADSADELLQQFLKAFPDYTADERERIRTAWEYLCGTTAGLLRACGKPYYQHPMRVACILAESRLDADTIVAGFLHNVLSLETVDPADVESRFGSAVFRIISGTAKITNLKIQKKTLHQADSIRKMLFAMIDDIRVILVKLADRLDRMRNLSSVEPDVQKLIAQEVIDIWAPLANRLGMSSVKSELEDLSLKFTNPDVYAQLKSIVALKKNERSDYLEKAQKEIYRAASRAGIEIAVSSRAKHFYSIYQKMRKRNKAADELFDLLALRVICNTSAECYTLVGLVHNLWKPLDGRFKDYIAMPKANGYQSLHTTVLCEGMPLEIQIRTKDMHSVAEYGVASHWLYKKGTNHDEVSVDNLSIINQLKKLRNEYLNDENFFNEIKEDLLGDSIYVFTPKGDVIELPAGSTAIDFAYQIHSAIGEKITGAKADGQIIPLSKPLKNTQSIDVLTNPQAHPTANQLQMVRTAKARSKIRAWLLQNDPGFSEKQPVPGALKSAAAESDAAASRPHRRGDGVKPGVPPVSGGQDKIRIGTTTNFLVTKAGCCKPVFGDPIVGFVSRGRGIIIHRADCSVFARIPNCKERSLEVEWDEPAEIPAKKAVRPRQSE